MTGLPLLQSTSFWTARQTRWAVLLFTVIVFTVGCAAGWRFQSVFSVPDAGNYLRIARGIPESAPFTSRLLGPLLARLAARLFRTSAETAFLVQGGLALALFATAAGRLVVSSGVPRWMLAAIGGSTFWSFQFNALCLPDLLYGALLSVFLLLLRRQQLFAAALMMFPLMLTRESTMLTLVCFLLAGWRRLRAVEIAAAFASLLAAALLVKRLTIGGAPNVEHISPLLYLFAKVPWNFAKNVLGISLWADVNGRCGVPQWKLAVPFGPVHAIGSCGFSPMPILLTAQAALTVFGLLPLLALRLSRTRGEQPVRHQNGGERRLLLRFCVVYGVLCFALAPSLGANVPRLFAYSWPLFLVAVPLLTAARRANFTSSAAAALFVVLHLALSWSVRWIYVPWQQIFVALAAYVLGWLLLRFTFHEDAPGYLSGTPAEPVF